MVEDCLSNVNPFLSEVNKFLTVLTNPSLAITTQFLEFTYYSKLLKLTLLAERNFIKGYLGPKWM